jgi:hypothetical protein
LSFFGSAIVEICVKDRPWWFAVIVAAIGLAVLLAGFIYARRAGEKEKLKEAADRQEAERAALAAAWKYFLNEEIDCEGGCDKRWPHRDFYKVSGRPGVRKGLHMVCPNCWERCWRNPIVPEKGERVWPDNPPVGWMGVVSKQG